MSTFRLLTVSACTSLCLWASVATAQQPQALASPPLPPPQLPPSPLAPPPAPTPPRGPSDLELRAIGQSPVSIQMADGALLSCQIMTSDPTTLVLRLSSTGQIISVPRAQVLQITVQQQYAPPPADAEPVMPLSTTRKRHFGMALSIVPGLALDLDVGMFRAFANLGIVLPLATSGEFLPISMGAGVGIPLSKSRPTLKLDVMGYVTILVDAKDHSYSYGGSNYKLDPVVNNVSAGVGLGLHYTWQNGLTLGGMVPILGYAAYLNDFVGTDSTASIGQRSALFYLASAASLPLFYLGYRF